MDNLINTLNIFRYTDYRVYLKDLFFINKSNKHVSYDEFAKAAWQKSRSYIVDIMKGRRPISPKSIKGYCKALGLPKREEKRFKLLLTYNDAKNATDKEEALKELIKTNEANTGIVTKNLFESYSKMYYRLVLRALETINFDNNYRVITKRLGHRIDLRQAKKAIKVLLSTGLIKKKGKYYKPTFKHTISEENFEARLLLDKYHKEFFRQMIKEMEKLKPEKRLIKTQLIAGNKEFFEKAIKKMLKLDEEIGEMADDSDPETEIYQFATTIFKIDP